MKYQVNGSLYVALRAVPAMTGGALTAETLRQAISDPDGFCDTEYGEVISPKHWDGQSRWLDVAPQCFSPQLTLVTTPSVAPPCAPLWGADQLPPGNVVSAASIREKRLLVLNNVRPRNECLAAGATLILDLEPRLTPQQLAIVLAGLPTPRSNGVAAIHSALNAAYEAVAAACASQGLVLDRHSLPGGSKHWLPIVERCQPAARRLSPDALKRHFKFLGLRWRQGIVPDDVNRFLDAVRKSGI